MTTKKTPQKEFTRECQVRYDQILFTNSKSTTNEKWEADLQLDYAQMNQADNYLVGYIFDLLEEEVMKMSQKEFKQLLEVAKKLKDDPLSETTTS